MFLFLRILLLFTQMSMLSLCGKPCLRAPGTQCDKLAQTANAYQGYCKRCFAILFPVDAARIKKIGKKHCAVCGAHRELTRSLCRPCLNTRSCTVCDALNLDKNAGQCVNCEGLRKSLGAVQPRLSLWCTNCSTEEDRLHQLR